MNKILGFLFFSLLCIEVLTIGHIEWDPTHHALDQSLLESVLIPELCEQQLNYLRNNTLLKYKFLDAGIRTPRGIFDGNLVDYGNYYQCLGIQEQTDNSIIEGKYCSITVPLAQDALQLPSLPDIPEWPDMPWHILHKNNLDNNESQRSVLRKMSGLRNTTNIDLSSVTLRLAVCVPKSCTTREALDSLIFNISGLGFQYQDNYCRLPNDKPWVPADYVAVVIFSLLGLMTIMSTLYDVYHTILLKKDPQSVNKLYQSFSVYTNARRLVTYTPNARTLECLDGIRVMAICWIILGHTYTTQATFPLLNPTSLIDWLTSFHSILVTASPICVDTFLMLSGTLLVYTVCGKMNRMSLLKNVHLFYLQRLLRMFPILATAILLQASVFNRVADGPDWSAVITNTHNCRTYWWSTLLYIQNYLNPGTTCISHSWYLAVDTQLHILSPIVLFWVLSGRKSAWIAMSAALLIALVAATTFNAIRGFRAALVNAGQISSGLDYNFNYYQNTLTRASPFFVGMIFGYLLYSYRDTKMRPNKYVLTTLWSVSVLVLMTVIYVTYPIQQAEWDNKTMDIILNSFMRPVWAVALGWLVFACVQGYGGPINWLLSLRMWKVPSRLSYAMYIFHYQLQFIVNSMTLVPFYFADDYLIFKFLGDLVLTVVVSFLATVLVDSPFSTLIKIAIGGGAKKKTSI